MQPIDAEARPRVHEPALNHVGLWIDDLVAAVAWLEEQGVRFTPGGHSQGRRRPRCLFQSTRRATRPRPSAASVS